MAVIVVKLSKNCFTVLIIEKVNMLGCRVYILRVCDLPPPPLHLRDSHHCLS